MKERILGLFFVWTFACMASAFAFAQGGATSSISGVVLDTAGGAIPGVTVVARNEAGATFETVSNAEGVFSVPALGAGTYTVTASLSGFKTAVVSGVRLTPGNPAAVRVTLEVGGIEETVNVVSSAELINTQTATVSSTLNADQINRMPTPTRNALNAVTFLPGVNTATINRNSTINGLPESFINITMDGVSNADNFNKSTDGFFASVTPRQDAVEAVTVTTAVGGAETGGSGAVAVNFVTRSGTNRFSGSAYEYFRDPSLNSNYWFNKRNGLPRNEVKLNQYGARAGGPIVMPGLFDGRDTAFFFANYEQLKFPNSFSRTRTVLHPRALDGWFRYNVGGQLREVNVLDLAARNGQIAAVDPTVRRILGNIASASASGGALNATTDPLLNSFVWQSPGELFEHQPSVRVDYNLSDRHRLSGSGHVIFATRDPDYLNNTDVRFPGAPNFRLYDSTRPLYSLTLRSTLSSNMVNELRGGTTRGGASYFGDPSSNGPQTFADQDGYAIDLDANIGLTNWHTTNGPSWRSAYTYSIDNTLSWQRGTHSFSFGGSTLLIRAWENEQQMVPGINLRFDQANDPAAGLFTGGNSGNFPSASAANLNDARDLYALLTGRVGAVTGLAALNDAGQYVAFGPVSRRGRMDVHSLFAQDSWRVAPTLTLNGGLRWEVQMPFTPINNVMSSVTMADICGVSGAGPGGTYGRCAFYQPGASGGITPSYAQLTSGTRGYETDWNNLAPNVGIAWRPDVETGFLRKLLGDPEQATLRAGYSVAYDRQGMAAFVNVYDGNPGGTISLSRDASTGIVGPGESWPVLLSQRDRLGNATFPDSPTYPIALRPNRADDLNGFAPDIQVASAHSWTVSFQRSITKDMAVDIRYVGTRGVDQWSTINYNSDFNMIENGFLNEFRLAMANLQANNASGVATRSGSFAYFGPGTGTSPLPIYLAYLNGSRDFNNPAAYANASTNWQSTGLASRMVGTNPLPETSAADLDGNLTRRQNAVRAGLPGNFFIVNPDVDDANVTDSGAYSDYHALQIELRRRLSRGLQANVSYQYALEGGSAFLGFRYGRVLNPAANVRHAIKTQWDWTIPVGRGERFGSDLHPVLNGILGGWQFNGVGRIQARTINFGNVRLVGMTVDELTGVYKHDIRLDPETGLQTVFMLPQDIIDNTRRAFNVSTTSPTGYSALGVPEGRYFAPANSADCLQLKAGDCAPRTLLVRAPFFTRFDIGVTKKFPIHGQMNFEFRVDVLNVFDNVNFDPFVPANSNAAYQAATFAQVTAAYQDPSNTFDPGGRLGQIMFRFNW